MCFINCLFPQPDNVSSVKKLHVPVLIDVPVSTICKMQASCIGKEYVPMDMKWPWPSDCKTGGDVEYEAADRRRDCAAEHGCKLRAFPFEKSFSSYTVGVKRWQAWSSVSESWTWITARFLTGPKEVCASHLLANTQVIGGPNTSIEVDESLFVLGTSQE